MPVMLNLASSSGFSTRLSSQSGEGADAASIRHSPVDIFNRGPAVNRTPVMSLTPSGWLHAGRCNSLRRSHTAVDIRTAKVIHHHAAAGYGARQERWEPALWSNLMPVPAIFINHREMLTNKFFGLWLMSRNMQSAPRRFISWSMARAAISRGAVRHARQNRA